MGLRIELRGGIRKRDNLKPQGGTTDLQEDRHCTTKIEALRRKRRECEIEHPETTKSEMMQDFVEVEAGTQGLRGKTENSVLEAKLRGGIRNQDINQKVQRPVDGGV